MRGAAKLLSWGRVTSHALPFGDSTVSGPFLHYFVAQKVLVGLVSFPDLEIIIMFVSLFMFNYRQKEHFR